MLFGWEHVNQYQTEPKIETEWESWNWVHKFQKVEN